MACSLKGAVCEALILEAGPSYKKFAGTQVISAAWLHCLTLLDNVTLKILHRNAKKCLIVEQGYVSKSSPFNSSLQSL